MRGLFYLTMLSIASACDAYTDASYAGEPLLAVNGMFVSVQGTSLRGDMALLWQTTSYVGVGSPTRVPYSIEFPASFTIELIEPPPSAVVMQFDAAGEPEFAEGYVFVVPAAGDPGPAQTLGTDYEHAIVYAGSDVAAGTLAADYLGAPMSAGYHLMSWIAGDPKPTQKMLIDRCIAEAAAAGIADSTARCTALRRYSLEPAPPTAILHVSLMAR